MIIDSYLDTGAVVPADDAPYTTTYFDLEQFGSASQSDNADQQLPLDRWLNLVVDTAFNECTTMQFDIITDDAITFNTGPTIVASTGAIAVADLVAGYTILSINLAGLVLDRYLSFDNTKGGSTETTGKVRMFIGGAPLTPLNTQKEPS